MEIIEAIRRRSRSRDSNKNEDTSRRHSPHHMDPPVHDHDDDHSQSGASSYDYPENYDRIKQDSLG
jgi:PAB1-binding protein PBP1